MKLCPHLCPKIAPFLKNTMIDNENVIIFNPHLSAFKIESNK